MCIRDRLRKYEKNIEIVDPQLKNNPELVEALVSYETCWEKGKNYFLDGKKCGQLIHFSQLLEAVSEKYTEFEEQIECRDADIFVSIPCLVLLKSLENDDKGICLYFLPALYEEGDKVGKVYAELKGYYHRGRAFFSSPYQYYNLIEKLIVGIPLSTSEDTKHKENKPELDTIIHKIKQLSIELQRSKPSEWNEFLDVVLGS
eukprot:TRINITY_DN11922_c0_g1_i5.p1 TRINITY_DN11922_c0_g1~~TRINITY_DN11922_c0_g1_i5.p1  ORF type:complete len:202 (+),score=25.21 TRINITY_DN11922_c0_g1_i5:64-669(+)